MRRISVLFLVPICVLNVYAIDFDALEKKKTSHKTYRLDAKDAEQRNNAAYQGIVSKQRKALAKILPPASEVTAQKDICLGKWEKSFCYSHRLSSTQRDMCLGKWEKSFCYSHRLSSTQRDICLGNHEKNFCYSHRLSPSQRDMCLGNWEKNFCYSHRLSPSQRDMCLGSWEKSFCYSHRL